MMTSLELDIASPDMHATRKAAAIKVQAFLYDALNGDTPIVTRERAEQVVDAIVIHMLTVIRDGFSE